MAFCINCGAQIKDGAQFCSQCGQRTDMGQPVPQQGYQQPQAYQQPQKPMPMKAYTHMTFAAIATTIFCCFPVGIYTLIQLNQVEKLWNTGRYHEAVEKVEIATDFIKISIVVGIAFYIIGIWALWSMYKL